MINFITFNVTSSSMDANKMWGELQVDFGTFFNFCYFQISSTIYMSYTYRSIIIYPFLFNLSCFLKSHYISLDSYYLLGKIETKSRCIFCGFAKQFYEFKLVSSIKHEVNYYAIKVERNFEHTSM